MDTSPPLASVAKASLRTAPAGTSASGLESGGRTSGGFISIEGTTTTKPADLTGAFRAACSILDPTDKALRLREIIRTLSAEEMPDAVEKAKRLSGYDQYIVMNALGSRWVELDVKGALGFATQPGKSSGINRYNPLLNSIISKWAASSPDEATAWVVSLPIGNRRTLLASTLLESLGNTNPEGALQLLNSKPGLIQGSWQVENFFDSWASRDPAAAAAAALELKGENKDSALRGAARSMAKQDAAAAMDWAGAIQNPLTRKQMIETVATEWGQSDPLAVIRWSANLKDEEQRRQIFANALSSLATTDLPAALTEIKRMPEGEQRDHALMRTAQALSNTDARSAIGLLNELPATPEKARALSSLCSVWGASEPRAALDWLFQNSTPARGDYALTNTLGRWAQQAPEEALAWVQSISEAEKRDTARAAISASLAYSDLSKAQQLFKTLSPDSQAEVAERLAYSMVSQGLPAAKSWTESLPPGRAQASAMGVVAYQYAQQDSTAAAKWIEQLPAGSGRDQAVSSFASYAVNRDPEGAVTWALTISDERDRTKKVEDLSRQWINTDAAGARRWIQNTNQLTAEQKRRILER